MSTHTVLVSCVSRASIANAADSYREILRADEGAQYDQLIEINLDELEAHINGPFTPDRAFPLSQFKKAMEENEWPTVRRNLPFPFFIKKKIAQLTFRIYASA